MSAVKTPKRGRVKNQTREFNIELLYEVYQMFNANIEQMRDYIREKKLSNLPLNDRTIRTIVINENFVERADKDDRKRIDKDLKKAALDKRKILMIVDNAMIMYAKNIEKSGGPKTAQEFRSLWEVHQLLLGEPISITENTNKGEIDAYITAITNKNEPANTGENPEHTEPMSGIGVLTTSGARKRT